MLCCLRRLFVPVFLLATLASACGDDASSDDDTSTLDAGVDASANRPTKYEATLVPVTATDASQFIAEPHEVSLLDQYGNPLAPPVGTTSGPDGHVSLDLPAAAVSLYVIGVGPANDPSSTYDTVLVSNNWSAGDPLLRISGPATLALVTASASFKARDDRATLTGAVYWTTNGVRRNPVGCVKLYIDGATAPDEDQVQRYMKSSLLPVPLDMQAETSRLGRFYFGNVKVGLHSLRASIDDGASFIGVKSFFVGRTRAGAQSPTKAMLYQFAVDIEASTDPTPADCPL